VVRGGVALRTVQDFLRMGEVPVCSAVSACCVCWRGSWTTGNRSSGHFAVASKARGFVSVYCDILSGVFAAAVGRQCLNFVLKQGCARLYRFPEPVRTSVR
jgi:hypothetical protein